MRRPHPRTRPSGAAMQRLVAIHPESGEAAAAVDPREVSADRLAREFPLCRVKRMSRRAADRSHVRHVQWVSRVGRRQDK